MKIAITGGNGFIGKSFLAKYGNEWDEVILLRSSDKLKEHPGKNTKECYAPIVDYTSLKKNLQGVDILVHCAFDTRYLDNISGIKNLLKAAKACGIKKLIHLSTISVYDLKDSTTINESSAYASNYEPYSLEKRKIEAIIKQDNNEDLTKIVLQPTVVYGEGGNWSKVKMHFQQATERFLPREGSATCGFVSAEMVADAIFHGVKSMDKDARLLVNGENKTWIEFLTDGDAAFNEVKNDNQNPYHGSSLFNLIMTFWFKTPLGLIFNWLLRLKASRQQPKVPQERKEEVNSTFATSFTTRWLMFQSIQVKSQFDISSGHS